MLLLRKCFVGLLITLQFIVASNAQVSSTTISGLVKEKANNTPIAYVNIIVKNVKDSSFVVGTVSN